MSTNPKRAAGATPSASTDESQAVSFAPVPVSDSEIPTGKPAGTIDWATVAADLRRSPGQWFLVGKNVPASSVTALKSRYGLEVRMRSARTPDGRSVAAEAYARAPKAEEVSE